ncbi:CHASE2 domain-containing protein [Roseateles sp.]|uniref:CHASE2 domain-containing protein n=1 Tax=Roseateles sp. TaxID=1971397 RepID=UPI003264E268
MPRPQRTRRLAGRHGWRGARLGLLLFVAAFVALGAFNGLGRADALLSDRLLAWAARPMPQDIVVVGIDDASLAAIGRWPWPRDVHARLLDALTAAAPRAVGLDLLLSEPDAAHDAQLAAAMRRNGRVVLPLRMAPMQPGAAVVSLPAPALAAAAAGLGHVHVALDADGVARRVFLHEGFGDVLWENFALAVLRAAGEELSGPPPGADVGAGAEPGRWRRAQPYTIPFAGPPGHVRRLSYLDVLEGRVPPASLRGAIVLVGATAPGLSDAYPTPMASQDALMPGVEMAAQTIAALREGRSLRAAAPWEAALLTLLVLGLAALALRLAPPRLAVGALLALLPAAVCLAWALQLTQWAGVQWQPGAALLGLLLLYPLWSWQRLEAALAYLAREFERTRQQLPPGEGYDPPAIHGDLLDRRMAALAAAAAHVRSLQRQRQQALHFLSHDLRAPLSATLALIELQDGAHAASVLPLIEAQSRRALAMAEGFVQLARAETAQGYRLEVLDLRDALIEAVDGCWPLAQARAVTLDCPAPAHECLVSGDRSMLTRALVNLIDNALKHGSPRGGRVHCQLMAAGACWRIEVRDAGVPLRPELATGLFEAFRRGGSGVGAQAGAPGAGLGLAFVQAVAQHHGGHAGWCGQEQGNVFFIELPASAAG